MKYCTKIQAKHCRLGYRLAGTSLPYEGRRANFVLLFEFLFEFNLLYIYILYKINKSERTKSCLPS